MTQAMPPEPGGAGTRAAGPHEQSHTHAQAHDPLYAELAASADFQELRRRYRGFVFPWTAAFLVWFLLYVSLSSWAPDFMGTEVFGNINIGLIMGLLQFVTTFGIAYLYSKHASASFDPLADAVNAEYERQRGEGR